MGCNERRMSSRDLILEFLRLQLYNNTIAITKKPKENKMGKIKETFKKITGKSKKEQPKEPEFVPDDKLYLHQHPLNRSLSNIEKFPDCYYPERDIYEYKLVRKIKVTPNPPTIETIKEY